MSKKTFFLAEIISVIFSVILFFLAKQHAISAMLATFVLLAVSAYFFPVRLFLQPIIQINLVSGILLSANLATGIILLFVQMELLALIFTALNFVFLLYLVFSAGQIKVSKQSYQTTVLLHFLCFFLFN